MSLSTIVGESPTKVTSLSSSSHLVADLDTFLAKAPTVTSPTAPIPQMSAPVDKSDSSHTFTYQVSVTKTARHKKGNVVRSRSIKRVPSQKRSEHGQSVSRDEVARDNIPSMEMLLEILATVVSRAPDQWAPIHLIDFFKQSRGHTIQELLKKLPTTASQYMMFLTLKISSTWIETFIILRAKGMPASNTSTSDSLYGSSSIMEQPSVPVNLKALRNEARCVVSRKLAAYIFLRPPETDVGAPFLQGVELKDPSGMASSSQRSQVTTVIEADAITALEVLIRAYENLSRRRKAGRGATESRKTSVYPTRKSSLASLKRTLTLTPADIPSLSLPPWRKSAPGDPKTMKSNPQGGQPSVARTFLRRQEHHARETPITDSESSMTISEVAPFEVATVNTIQRSSNDSKLSISACIPHPVSAMLAVPVIEATYNPEQLVVPSHPAGSDSETDATPNTFPWSTETPHYPTEECLSFGSQFNSDLLVRAAAAAYNYRSSYRQCLSNEQSQQRPRRSRSKARTCGAIIAQGSTGGMGEFGPISSHHSLPISAPETKSLGMSSTLCFGKAELSEEENFDKTEATTGLSDNISTMNLQDEDEPDEPLKPPPLQKVDVVLAKGADLPPAGALDSSAATPSIDNTTTVTSPKPVMPLKIKSAESKNVKRHRPPPFVLETASLANSLRSPQSPPLTHTMVMPFSVKMTTNPDTQVGATAGSTSTLKRSIVGQMPHASTEVQQQENLTQDIRNIESPSPKKGRQLWTKSSLLLKPRSSSKTDLSVGLTTGNAVSNPNNSSSPIGTPKSLKITNQSELFLNSITNETSDSVMDVTMSSKTRRHMQSRSQDFTRAQRSIDGVVVSNGKSIRHVRSGASLRSSTKAISMPLPEVSSPVLRSPANSAALKASPSVDEISSKTTPSWPSFLWRNPFQPSSPSQTGNESSELLKQRNSPEEPSSPSPPSSVYPDLRRKKSIHEKLFGKWSKKMPSFSSPLSSPQLSSGTLEYAPCNRYSASSFSACGSSATSPTLQHDHGHTREPHWYRLTNETGDSNYDRMNASLSKVRKKGKEIKAISPREKRDSKTGDVSRQDEIWERILDIAMDNSSNTLKPENEEPYTRSKLEALWIDDENDFDGDYEEEEDNDDCDESDDDRFDFETGGYEITNSRRSERESKSEAYICRVMEQWQVWSIAHAAII
ncbi:hypothetical protein BGZ80_000557 [Entomortierella chlamydospora]|uniref:Uncharacterized protein n=1 Tax=Entomortierella chlamydospora TaxID=101097 RepID=A0A9P6SYI6_9FUNG|nr:hypothetical protein BGZ79_006223 [Entomortierella chlamydospora]KAG0011612.1 hypothetical protein BGZ80_000557 [Entomortierella chlamydospora]